MHVCPNDLQQPTLTIRDDLAILGSDHKLMTLSFMWDNQISAESENTQQQRKRWKINRLIDHDVATAYITTFNNQIQEKNLINKLTTYQTYLATIADISSIIIENQQENIDTIEYFTEEFYNTIYYSLNTIITEADCRPKNWKWFWNKSLQGRANFRQACYTRWRKSIGIQSGLWWSRYKAADRDLKKEVKQARTAAYHKFCEKLDDDPTAAIPIVKRIINSKNKNTHRYTTEEGPQHAADTMAQYLEGIFNGSNLPQPQNNTLHTTNTSNTNISINSTETFNTYDFHDCPFTENHIYNAIKRLPNKKSPGSDHITSEMIKPIIQQSSTILNYLFRICWITGYTPKLWRQSQIVPIYKGAGDQTQPSNYRPISLISTFRKIMEYCLQAQLYQQTNFISIQQGGFKPKLAAMDHAVVLDELMHRFKNNNNNTPPTVITLDVAKAYDQCPRDTIWNTMYNKNCNQRLLNILKNLFDQVSIQVINGNHQSPNFQPITGVLQGSVLSPHLYSIFINSLPQQLSEIHPTNNLQDINCLLFADDVVLISSSNKMQNLLNISPTVKYLDLQFNHLGMDTQAHINTLKEKVNKSMQRIHQIGARTNGFSLLLSVKIYKQFIRPKIEYGLSITNFKATNFAALERLQDDCLRMIIGGFTNSSVKSLRIMVNLPSMVERCKLNIIKNKNPIYQALQQDNSPISIFTKITHTISSYRSNAIINSSEKMIQGCRSDLKLDPILTIPMTRKERRRILRWRMNWLPGGKPNCHCDGQMSRNHLFVCPAIPKANWEHIQRGFHNDVNPIDAILKSLPINKPKSITEKQNLIIKWQPLWTDLLNILFLVDQICHKTQETLVDEPDPGILFYKWIME
ncbi:hypothetical protein INT47_004826 [Mucor saturninus]|uniref:Reverse transcriptase domain-containing protein n=1 Tax=Mucor saturninus TaxID=64648 RepID=A0A8H7USP9_9FUNG|nr:hypothetical protein INT47_004826 [Mucor saturninus]